MLGAVGETGDVPVAAFLDHQNVVLAIAAGTRLACVDRAGAVRDMVHEYEAYDIQTKTQEISTHILERLREVYADSPIEFESISIGNITYPAEINAEIQRKLAAEQDLERMSRERQIAEQEAQIVVTNARGRAAAQRIVNETLTPLYVQHEMLESFTQLSRSQRVTIIAAPTGDSGSSPVLLGL